MWSIQSCSLFCRSAYFRLGLLLRQSIPCKAMLALTATATSATQAAIADALDIPPDGIIQDTSIRPNLRLRVSRCQASELPRHAWSNWMPASAFEPAIRCVMQAESATTPHSMQQNVSGHMHCMHPKPAALLCCSGECPSGDFRSNGSYTTSHHECLVQMLRPRHC